LGCKSGGCSAGLLTAFFASVIILEMNSSSPKQSRKQYWLNLSLAVIAGQVGCLTTAIVLVALFAGLWLDSHFHTRPTLTIVLVLGSIPISLVVMLLVVRSAIKRIKTEYPKNTENTEEANIGKET
jgi:F0F1-type ATP synthase assembly protein I